MKVYCEECKYLRSFCFYMGPKEGPGISHNCDAPQNIIDSWLMKNSGKRNPEDINKNNTCSWYKKA